MGCAYWRLGDTAGALYIHVAAGMLLCYTIITSPMEPHAPRRQELAISASTSYRDWTGFAHSGPVAHVVQGKGGLPPLLGAGERGSPKEERLCWPSPGGSGGPLRPTLHPSPALRGGVGSIPLPTSQAATTPDLGYTEGPLLALKGPCVPLPARPPRASPPPRSRNTQPRPVDSRTHPPTGQKRPAPPALPGDASACPCALNPGLEPRGRSLCLCQLELLECSERQNYSPAERQRPTPWDSPGGRRAVLAPSLGPGFPRKAPGTRLPSAGTSPAWLHPREERPLRPPRLGAPCGPGLRSGPGRLLTPGPGGRGGGRSHAAAGRDLAAVPKPGHLRPRKAGDARGADDGGLSVGDALVFLAFLEAAHVCGREERM